MALTMTPPAALIVHLDATTLRGREAAESLILGSNG
jgi:hypothetical protein